MDISQLWRPFRSALSFLADLGGALLLVGLAVGFIAAALSGAAIAALDVLDQPFFTLLVVGIALGAAGLAVHLLRVRMSPPFRPAQAPSKPELTPNDQAVALERAYREQFGDSAARKLREASRRIREELLDNRLILDRLLDGEHFDAQTLRFSQWKAHHDTLIEHTDPAPHTTASQAHRKIRELWASQYTPAGDGGRILRLNPNAQRPPNTNVRSTIEAIDKAVKTLDSLNA